MKQIELLIPLVIIAACAPTSTPTPVPLTSTLTMSTPAVTLTVPTPASTYTSTAPGVLTSTPQATRTQTAASTPVPGDNLDYDRSRDVVVIYADVQPYPVAPRGKECLVRYYPRLRVWRDGLVFLETSELEALRAAQLSLWNGQLDPDQVHSVLKLMDEQGFFGKWDVGMPPPTAIRLRVGANLKSKSVEYSGGTERLYTDIVRRIMPHVSRLSEQTNEARIKKLLVDSKPCIEGQ